MADIDKLLFLSNGVKQKVLNADADSLLSLSIKIGTSGGGRTELTKAILDNLITLQDGSDILAAIHHHDNRYYTETEIGAVAGGADGASLVGYDAGAANLVAANVSDALDELDAEKLALAGGTMSGAIAMGANKITGLADGTASNDAINKSQLDAAVAGLSWKQPAVLGSNANIASLTGITLTDFDGQGQGVTLEIGDRVLLKAQTTGSENGIYIVVAGPDLQRDTDLDASPEADGAAVFVTEGSDADTGWTQTADSVDVGTDAQVWAQFTGTGAIVAGAGLSKSGSTLDVGDVNKGVQVNADDLEIDASEIAGDGLKENGVNSHILDLDLKASAGLKIDTAQLSIEPADFAGDGLEDDGADNLRVLALDSSIAIAAGGISVASSPKATKSQVAGEAFAANTSFLVRWAISGETAGRVYKADKDASASDLFFAFGIALDGAAISAADPLEVLSHGSHTLGSSDTNFGAGDIGKPVFLLASGAFSITAPLGSDEANYVVGFVEDVNKIWIQPQVGPVMINN